MNCETENIVKGQDATLSLELYDQTGNIINPTLFNKLVITVRHANGTVICKFSKNAAAGYESMSLFVGLVIIRLLTKHTMAATVGKLYYEVHGQINDVAILDDSVLDLISVNNYLCTIINSITGGTTLP